MTDIVTKQEDKSEEKTGVNVNEIKETLKAADEYQRLKDENDKLEGEYLRQQELRAKLAIGGRTIAGQPEKTELEKSQEEAAKILSMFQ